MGSKPSKKTGVADNSTQRNQNTGRSRPKRVASTAPEHLRGQLVSIHVGQAGIQIGDACWELYCLEHGLDAVGQPVKGWTSPCSWESADAVFSQAETGIFTPRALFVDLETQAIDRVRTGQRRGLYHPDQLLDTDDNTSDNFARAFYTVGPKRLPLIINRIRKLTEECSNLRGFLVYHSNGGGTGSGLTALLSEHLAECYGKNATKFEFLVQPSAAAMTSIVEPYNAVLSMDRSAKNFDCSAIFDNTALFDIFEQKFSVSRLNFTHANRLIAKTASSVTAAHRFSGEQNLDIEALVAHLAPSPSLRYVASAYAPLLPVARGNNRLKSLAEITSSCFDSSNQLLDCGRADELRFNITNFIAAAALYRGDVDAVELNNIIDRVRANNRQTFRSTGALKVAINQSLPIVLPDEAKSNRAACMLFNTPAIVKSWEQLVSEVLAMFRRKAFLHYYTEEGMDEIEVFDAGSTVSSLIEEYRNQGSTAANKMSKNDIKS